jgi:type I restriction enzyme, S subunit
MTRSTLDSLCELITDGAHTSPREFPNGIPMMSVKDMTDKSFSYDNCKTISTEDAQELTAGGCRPKIGDVLIAKDGSVLKHVFTVKRPVDYVLLSSIAIIRPKKDKLISEFLEYKFKNPQFKSMVLSSFLGGSGVPRIVLRDFKKVLIDVPPLKEQKAIAEVLSSLDDKIELLQKQNETLEALAQTLFRQWFIEEADDSWEEVELGELVDITSGYVHKSHELVESEATPLLGMGVIGSSFLLKKEKARFISSNNYKSSQIVDKASIILSTRDVTQEAEMLGLPVLADDSFLGSIVGSNMYLLRSLSVPTLFVFHSLRTQRFRQYVKENASGSTILMLRKGDLVKYRLRLPKTGYSQLDTIELLHNKIEKNANQSMTLMHLRDALLPKLMSGQVRVKLD